MRKQPRIAAVEAERPFRVRVHWAGSTETDRVDLKALVHRLKGLAPLRDPKLFKQVRVKEWGWAIEWPVRGQEIDVGADTLWKLALEQKGDAMPTETFREWRARRKLSLSGAAAALGLSRRMVAYYDKGAKPIPKYVWLATRGYDAVSGASPRVRAKGDPMRPVRRPIDLGS
jgi:hypothetical protein